VEVTSVEVLNRGREGAVAPRLPNYGGAWVDATCRVSTRLQFWKKTKVGTTIDKIPTRKTTILPQRCINVLLVW